ncbi:MAG TPA: putative Ig domain-containing protein, partial [Nitrospiraceae bacterium]|nr:putative Ig domain-containing protein [Nitrospiraceae bacterium]
FTGSPTVDVLPDRQSDGSFEFSRTRLEQINGASLNDGEHTVTLAAIDRLNRTTQVTVPFTLDTVVTTLAFDLDAASDTFPSRDQQTTAAVVTLQGQTEANVSLTLLEQNLNATANASGLFTIENVSLALGANTLTVRAIDASGNQRTMTRMVTRIVVNTAPVLGAIGNQTAREGQLLVFTATAADTDVPAQLLRFSLESGTGGEVPTGAAIDPITGAFTWTPSGTQVGVHTFDVVVGDGALTDRETIQVTVNAVNVAPVLGAIGNKTVNEEQSLTFTATAIDSDVPRQLLRFTLENGVGGLVPTGAAIDPLTGAFTWTPTEVQGPGTYTFDIVVSDGALTDRETIQVTVNEVVQPMATLQGLSDIPESSFTSAAFDVSADGLVVVGHGIGTSGLEASRWTAAGGMVSLTPGVNGQATATSGDGSVVVGSKQNHAFRWTAAGLVDLGALPSGSASRALDVSADGAVVVGSGNTVTAFGLPLGQQAFRWTQAGGMQSLGSLRVTSGGPPAPSEATAVSADGSVIVGWGVNDNGVRQVFRWTASTGMVGVPIINAEQLAVSADGSVIVGRMIAGTDGLYDAFRWSQASGLEVLPGLGGVLLDSRSVATDVSTDGTRVIGRAASPSDNEAVIWQRVNGAWMVRTVENILATDFGVDVSQWRLNVAEGITPDGRTIVGSGSNPINGPEAWRAVLPV